MNKLNTILFYLFCVVVEIANAQNNYVLDTVYLKSDFQSTTLLDPLRLTSLDGMDSAMKIIPGNYSVVKLVETFLGNDPAFLPDSNVAAELHHILFLKIDKCGKVADGVKYYLENAEYPFSCGVYRLHQRNVKITGIFNLSSLTFELINSPDYCGRDPLLVLSQRLEISLLTGEN